MFIFCVIDQTKHLNAVLQAWKGLGITGVTIIESTGLHRHTEQPHIPMRYALSSTSSERGNITLFSVVESEGLIQRCLVATEAVVGDFGGPNSRINVPFFTIPDESFTHLPGWQQTLYKIKRRQSVTPECQAETHLYVPTNPAVAEASGRYWDEKNQQVRSNRSSYNRVPTILAAQRQIFLEPSRVQFPIPRRASRPRPIPAPECPSAPGSLRSPAQ